MILKSFMWPLRCLTTILVLHSINLWAEPRLPEFKLDGKPVPKIVATVNEVPLHSDLLQREIMAFKMMSTRAGKSVDPASESKIARTVLEQEIDLELIYQEARQLKLSVDPQVVQNEITKIKEQFPSPAMFDSALMFQGLTEELLAKKIDKHLLAEEFLRSQIIPQVKVDDSRAKAYYDQNKPMFKRPQMYDVSHIFVGTLNDTQEGQAETEEARKEAQKMIQGINAEAREKIGTVAAELESGADFFALVKKYSEDDTTKDKRGNLGVLLPDTTIPELAEAMVRLKPGQTSHIIKSSFGYHIIKLIEVVPSEMLPYAEVKADILNIMLKAETEKLKNEAVAKFRKTAKIKTFL